MDKKSKNFMEKGIPAGTWNKYSSANPLQRMLVFNFLSTLRKLAANIADECETALDIGCGEGITTNIFYEAGLTRIRGMDFSSDVLKRARKKFPRIAFEQKNIYDLNKTRLFDFVSACEVLEHLNDPKKGLENVHIVCRKVVILSVPNEPLFRVLNLLAGKYWRDFGNSPGHLNHWSSLQFAKFVSQRFNIVRVCRPMPWTVLIARPKHNEI